MRVDKEEKWYTYIAIMREADGVRKWKERGFRKKKAKTFGLSIHDCTVSALRVYRPGRFCSHGRYNDFLRSLQA